MVQGIDWWIFKIQQWFTMQMGTENVFWKIKSFLPPLKVFYPTYDDFEDPHTESCKNINFLYKLKIWNLKICGMHYHQKIGYTSEKLFVEEPMISCNVSRWIVQCTFIPKSIILNIQ